MRRISVGTLIFALFIPLFVGAVSAALSRKGMLMYGDMQKPPLSPPPWVFSVAWTILYIMMGLASYFIIVSETDMRSKAMALIIYSVQLAMNFMWSIFFFNMGILLFSFVWLMIMWGIVILCALRFFPINRTAAFLLIPYILWLIFAPPPPPPPPPPNMKTS